MSGSHSLPAVTTVSPMLCILLVLSKHVLNKYSKRVVGTIFPLPITHTNWWNILSQWPNKINTQTDYCCRWGHSHTQKYSNLLRITWLFMMVSGPRSHTLGFYAISLPKRRKSNIASEGAPQDGGKVIDSVLGTTINSKILGHPRTHWRCWQPVRSPRSVMFRWPLYREVGKDCPMRKKHVSKLLGEKNKQKWLQSWAVFLPMLFFYVLFCLPHHHTIPFSLW